jgi:hypothetical protein
VRAYRQEREEAAAEAHRCPLTALWRIEAFPMRCTAQFL